MRKYYGESGQVTQHQILISEHLIAELLKAIHGQIGKHPGITKMIQECRSKYYYPGLAKKANNGYSNEKTASNTPESAMPKSDQKSTTRNTS